MGRYKQGILGDFSGKVGAVVGSNWRGISYMRGVSAKRSKRNSPAQVEQQQRFGFAVKFLRPFRNLLTLTFRTVANQMTERNSALSDFVKNVVTGTAPNLAVDFSKMEIARGLLENVYDPRVGAGSGSTVNFSWTDNSSEMQGVHPTDRAILVVYSEATARCVFASGTALRSGGSGTLTVPQFRGHTVHTWIAFMSEDGKQSSDSHYTGAVEVL
jgi:hypothetical protein